MESAFCSYCGSPNPEATPPEEVAELTADSEVLRRRVQAALGPDFTVEQTLGEGGFAVVFAAFDRKLSRRIAVKVLRPELTASRASKQRFVREAESVARLNHPHILPIFFVGEGGGLVWFGMPLVEGETLEARLRREGALSEAEAIRIGAEIADALAEAHAAGLVHRDIKPLNVMLHGPRGRVLVADFGIAKAAAGSVSGEKLTGTGVAIGSPHYMSPEQASGSDDVDHRSDIYSLGVLMWQMLAGSPPFEGSEYQQVLMQQVVREPPSLRMRRPDVRPDLCAIVERCMRKNPSERYQSAEEVAHALRAALLRSSPARSPVRLWVAPAVAAAITALALGIGSWWLRDGGGGRSRSEPAQTGAAPATASPVIAVLPFSAVTGGDTAQFARAAALILTEALGLRNGVATVDGNELLGRWIAEGRRITAPLEDHARFAYDMGANQMVLGTYVESGRSFRLSVTMYDTHDASRLWRDEVTGSTDSLFLLIDVVAARAAQALCSQPAYNPGNICYDSPARPRSGVTLTAEGPADTGTIRFHAFVDEAGSVADVRLAGPASEAATTARALGLVRDLTFEPARRGRRPVAAWTDVEVGFRQPGTAGITVAAACEDPAYGARNPNRECYDTRPVPRTRLPIAEAPDACASQPSPATVLVRVGADGAVAGPATLRVASDCPAFSNAAVAVVRQIGFAPATKGGRPVAAWTQLLVQPAGTRSGGSE